MEPFALLRMMWTLIANGLTSRLILYFILIAAGICSRLALKHKHSFRIVTAVSVGLWAICEVIVDIGSAREILVQLFSFAFLIGSLSFCFALGFLICSLVCKLIHRKQLA